MCSFFFTLLVLVLSISYEMLNAVDQLIDHSSSSFEPNKLVRTETDHLVVVFEIMWNTESEFSISNKVQLGLMNE